MKVEIPGIALAFEDVPVGSFFSFERRKREFAFCVSVGEQRAAIILSTPERPSGHMPWLAVGGLPHDVVISFPNAVLRASHLDISHDAHTYGYLISAGRKLFMRVGEAFGNYRTFNVETGEAEQLPDGKMAAAYSKWQIGITIDNEFEPIFAFPVSQV